MVKRVTQNAREDLADIAGYIRLDSPMSAMKFATNARDAFLDHPPNFKPRRVFPEFEEVVRVLTIKGFDGYLAYYAEMPDALYLLAVIAPGVSDARRQRMVGAGLHDMEVGAYD